MIAINAKAVQRKFPWAFTIFLLIWLITAIICLTVPSWSFAVVLLGIPWLLVPLLASVIFTMTLWQRRYRVAGRWLLFPVLCTIVFWYTRTCADRVWFELNRDAYQKIISDISQDSCGSSVRMRYGQVIGRMDCGPPMTVSIAFEHAFSTWHGFVYDQADEIAKPCEARSPTWRSRNAGNFLDGSEAYQSMGNHYYLVRGIGHSCDKLPHTP
jgi:hypothetical protein